MLHYEEYGPLRRGGAKPTKAMLRVPDSTIETTDDEQIKSELPAHKLERPDHTRLPI
jgi:hypothetical protein